jgi:hypothetical protein
MSARTRHYAIEEDELLDVAKLKNHRRAQCTNTCKLIDSNTVVVVDCSNIPIT